MTAEETLELEQATAVAATPEAGVTSGAEARDQGPAAPTGAMSAAAHVSPEAEPAAARAAEAEAAEAEVAPPQLVHIAKTGGTSLVSAAAELGLRWGVLSPHALLTSVRVQRLK